MKYLDSHFPLADSRRVVVSYKQKYARVKVFRINPEFRIFRLTFHRKSASKC